jgi:hypothetical protein
MRPPARCRGQSSSLPGLRPHRSTSPNRSRQPITASDAAPPRFAVSAHPRGPEILPPAVSALAPTHQRATKAPASVTYAKARAKIGLANLAYNFARLAWLNGRTAPV